MGGGRNWRPDGSRFATLSRLLEWKHGAPVTSCLSLWLDINVLPHGGKAHEILNKDKNSKQNNGPGVDIPIAYFIRQVEMQIALTFIITFQNSPGDMMSS